MTDHSSQTPASKSGGKVEEITSTANPRIKWIKGLGLKKNRVQENLFVAEGLKLVTDAVDGGWTVRMLVHARRLLEDEALNQPIGELAAKVRARGGDVLITSDKVLTSIARRDNPQMVMGVMEQKFHDLSSVKPADKDVWVALDRVRDPGNLGTIMRTADALGAKGVILVGETTDPFALEAVRATMGSLFHIKLFRASQHEFLQFAEGWRQNGGQIVGTHLKGAVDHRSLDYAAAPHILLMGNEQQGLTDELAQACSNLVAISMAGQADSLNLAIATGIALFEMRRHDLPSMGGTI